MPSARDPPIAPCHAGGGAAAGARVRVPFADQDAVHLAGDRDPLHGLPQLLGQLHDGLNAGCQELVRVLKRGQPQREPVARFCGGRPLIF